MTVERSQAGLDFWIGWVLASTVGMFVGAIMAMPIGAITELFRIE